MGCWFYIQTDMKAELKWSGPCQSVWAGYCWSNGYSLSENTIIMI